MAEFAVLRMSEGVRVDAYRVLEIYDQLGESAAEVVLGRAMEELAVALRDLSEDRCDDPLLLADRITALAWQVGLPTLARVAADVVDCQERGDDTGRAATLARLSRVANRSLTAIWDFQDERM